MYHRGIPVPGLVPEAGVSQKLPNGVVLVHQLVQTIEVTPQDLLQETHHEDPPQLHAGTPFRVGHLGKDPLLQDLEQPGTDRPVGIHVPKPEQQRRNVIPRALVDLDLLDRNLTQFHLQANDVSHGNSREDSRKSGRFSTSSADSRIKAGFFVPSISRFHFQSQTTVLFRCGH